MTVKKDFFEFGYRDSKLKSNQDILLSVVLELKKGNKKRIEDKMKKNLAQRSIRVPDRMNTAGCYFKNPQVDRRIIPAGRLLEEVGAKYLSGLCEDRNVHPIYGNQVARVVKKSIGKSLRKISLFLTISHVLYYASDINKFIRYLESIADVNPYPGQLENIVLCEDEQEKERFAKLKRKIKEHHNVRDLPDNQEIIPVNIN
jgi:hypothetical protein